MRHRVPLLGTLLAALAAQPAAQVLFAPPIKTPTSLSTVNFVVDDVDLDGHPDLVLEEEVGLAVRLGDGAGQFGAPMPIDTPAGGSPGSPFFWDADGDYTVDLLLEWSVASADLGGDGVPELIYPVLASKTTVYVHTGLGDGTYGAPAAYPLAQPQAAAAVDSGDADGDGDMDLLVAWVGWFGGGHIELFVNDGSGVLAMHTLVPSSDPFSLSARFADADGDGLLDVLADVSFFDGEPPDPAAVEVQLARPGGGFTFAGLVPDALAVDVGDVDGDGSVDLLTWHPGGAALQLGQGDGTFVLGDVVSLPPNMGPSVLADFDDDGLLDMLAHSLEAGESAVRRGTGGGHLASAGTSYTWDPNAEAAWPRIADVDSDGRADLVNAGAGGWTEPQIGTALNATYFAGSPLLDLGGALAGGAGWPIQLVEGSFATGTPATFHLWGAPASGAAHLVIGLSLLGAPFKGGTMVPHPTLITGPWPATPAGEVVLAGNWPAIPSGTELIFQFWFADPAGPAGFAASSGVQLLVP